MKYAVASVAARAGGTLIARIIRLDLESAVTGRLESLWSGGNPVISAYLDSLASASRMVDHQSAPLGDPI